MSRRFVHFTESFSAGVLSSLVTLTKAQVEDGARVEVIFCSREFTPSQTQLQELFLGVELVNLGRRSVKSLISMAIQFHAAISSHGTVKIHAHSSWAGMIIRFTNIFFRYRHVYFTPHSYAHFRSDITNLTSKVYELIERILIKLSDSIIIACSKKEFDEAKKLGSRKVIQGGNYITDPLAKWKINFNSDREERIFAGVGRLTPAKNPERFREIALGSPFPDNFRWIGGGNSSDEKKFSENNLSITGWLSPEETIFELSKIYCLVITSDWEALPMIAIEAMSLSRPIVSWNYCGVEEVITNEVNGFVCTTIEEMISKITLLARDQGTHSRMSREARKTFEQKFDAKSLERGWRHWYD